MLGDDISYLLDVLAIGHGETEDQLDDRLKAEARGLGLDVDEQMLRDTQICKPYLPESPRRSESIDSRTSRSTGLTSTFSDISKDPSQYHGQRRPSRTSLSFRDYDVLLSRGRPIGRQSVSFSPLATPSRSTFSLPLSQPSSPDLSPKKHFRLIRGLSILKTRNASNTSLAEVCLHCPLGTSHERRAIHQLPCGHRLCTPALRDVVKVATESKTGAIPSCCGRPIPGSFVEQVMTPQEQHALLDMLEQWDEGISLVPSISSSRRDSIPSISSTTPRRPGVLSRGNRGISEDSRPGSLSVKQRKEMEKMMKGEDYVLLRTGQSNQRDRFLTWSEKQRHELDTTHDRIREAVRMQHEGAVEEIIEHHAVAVVEAEDKQVKAEADMRESQDREKRDHATALKHMEAYCSGKYSSGERHNRTVTEQAVTELDKARRVRDQMDAKHESQINVLRGEQSRRMRLRAQRQDRELQDLKRQQRKGELEVERTCTQEMQELEDSVTNKRRKIKWRWELQMSILTKKMEAETGVRLENRLPIAEWSRKEQYSPQVAAHSVTEQQYKHGISHSLAVRGVPAHQQYLRQEYFKIGM